MAPFVDHDHPAAPAVAQVPPNLVAFDPVVRDLGVRREKKSPAPVVADANVVLDGVAANDQFRSIRKDAGSTSRDVVADDVVQDREAVAAPVA